MDTVFDEEGLGGGATRQHETARNIHGTSTVARLCSACSSRNDAHVRDQPNKRVGIPTAISVSPDAAFFILPTHAKGDEKCAVQL